MIDTPGKSNEEGSMVVGTTCVPAMGQALG